MTYAISPGQIKYIQTMRRQVFGSDDDAYRLMLWGQAGVKSCKDLKGARIDLVIGHLERCLGKRPPESSGQWPVVSSQQKPKTESRFFKATGAQLKEIRDRWDLVSRATAPERERALRNFLKRRFGVAAPEWLSLEEGRKVIEGLKAMERRNTGWKPVPPEEIPPNPPLSKGGDNVEPALPPAGD